jgi:hypothetical protein
MGSEEMIAKILDAPLVKLFLFLLVISVLSCPGILGMLVFEPERFKEIETAKMLYLSAAISVPIFLINMLVGIWFWFMEFGDVRHPEDIEASGVDMTPDNPEDTLEFAAFIGAAASLVPLYVPVLIRVFTSSFSLRMAALTVIGLEIIMVVVLLYAANRTMLRRVIEERKKSGRGAPA